MTQPLASLNPVVKGVSIDSRTAIATDMFIGIPCKTVLANCQDAYNKGVRTFIVEEPIELNDATILISPNARLAVGHLAAYFYPKSPEIIAAVTGTNGKSSTVSLLRQIYQLSGVEAASLGTLGLERSFGKDTNISIPSLTSLDAISLHKTLNYLSEQDVKAVAIEASSHGLDQYRLDSANLSVAAFTNLTQDHLDYHATMQDYFIAKSSLFSRVLKSGKPAVINRNSPYFENLKSIIEGNGQVLITYGINMDADFVIEKFDIKDDFIILDLNFKGTCQKGVVFPLCGAFQMENLLCACAMAYATGISIQDIIKSIPQLKSIHGRMEFVAKTKEDASIFVDYAHTPDALENILKSIRKHTQNNIHLVFGCGGNRDLTKRPIMGKIAREFADVVYVTNDNPRDEDDDIIRSQIINEIPTAKNIKNRSEAIQKAISNLQKGDVLIVAGKGHETGQIIKGVVHPFSDQEEIKKYVKEHSAC